MSESTRRAFLKYAGAGAAVAGVAAVTPAVLSKGDKPAVAGTSGAAESASIPSSVSGSIMAYVHDVHSGEMTLMVEGREVVVKDAGLVARLAQAMHVNAGRAVQDNS